MGQRPVNRALGTRLKRVFLPSRAFQRFAARLRLYARNHLFTRKG
jgi:hypothetical protein